jgi:macrolide-specific efflux system membrane fusion protein
MQSKIWKRAGRLIIFYLLACCLLTSGCSLFPAEEEKLAPPLMQPAKIEYSTITATRGSLVLQLRLTGKFYPENQQSLSFEKQGGRLKSLRVTNGDIVKKGDLIAQLDSGSIVSSIEIQALEVDKSQLSLSQMRANGADSYSVKKAQLDLQQQQIRLKDLQRQLEATQIFAPIDGQVTYLISTDIGEYVNAYQTVTRIADISRLVLQVTGENAADLPIGAGVTIEFNKMTFDGIVTANPTSLISDPDEQIRKSAFISFAGIWPAEASLGQSADVVYVQEKREDVLFLPRAYINIMSGRHYVNVLEDGVRVEKDVEIGLLTETEAEIIKGIDADDRIIIN